MASRTEAQDSGLTSELKSRFAQFRYNPEAPHRQRTMPQTRLKFKSASEIAASSGTVKSSEDGVTEVQAPSDVTDLTETDATPMGKGKAKRKGALNSETKTTPKKPRLEQFSSMQPVPAVNNLKDSLKPGLILVSIGLNPGIMTGKTGHAYAHPSNRYWPTLYASGIIPIQHRPEETLSLMDMYGIGHTNIIPTKATVGGNDLTKEDYLEGAKALDQKIRELRPQAAMIVGKGIWEEWFRYKRGRKMTKKDGFDYGWQDPKLNIGRKEGEWEGAKTFVVTTTSGLSSSHTKEERIAIWKPMGDWFAPKRDQWIKDRQERERNETAES